MIDKSGALRKTLSANIKKHRENLNFTQEKLAEAAGMSANMVNDIEGCRTWISDKTLVNLATALNIEIYRLFIPLTTSDNEVTKTVVQDLAQDLQKINKDINSLFETSLKSMGVKG
jgi:transcriptional regulator with XRE-family HTH domain